MSDSQTSPEPHAILVFDGACALCNGFVNFLVARDRQARYRFSASQSPFGAKMLIRHGLDPKDPSSILMLQSGRVLVQSTAALAAVSGLGGGWRLVAVLRLIPMPLRDKIYRLVARNRYRWFGRTVGCPAAQGPASARFVS